MASETPGGQAAGSCFAGLRKAGKVQRCWLGRVAWPLANALVSTSLKIRIKVIKIVPNQKTIYKSLAHACGHACCQRQLQNSFKPRFKTSHAGAGAVAASSFVPRGPFVRRLRTAPRAVLLAAAAAARASERGAAVRLALMRSMLYSPP